MGTIALFQNLIVLGLTSILAGTLARRRTHNQFPFFAVYAYCAIAIEAARLSVFHQYLTYFKVYWATEAIFAVLALLALHEIFRRVFTAFYADIWFKLLFPAVIVVASLFATWQASYHPPIQATRIIAVILLFGLAVSFIKSGLFCLFMSTAKLLKLQWRFAPLGIALGFAASGIGGLIAYWARSEIGTKIAVLAQYVAYVFNLLAIVIWLVTFLKPEPEPQWISKVTPRLLTEAIQRETESLKKLIGKQNDRYH